MRNWTGVPNNPLGDFTSHLFIFYFLCHHLLTLMSFDKCLFLKKPKWFGTWGWEHYDRIFILLFFVDIPLNHTINIKLQFIISLCFALIICIWLNCVVLLDTLLSPTITVAGNCQPPLKENDFHSLCHCKRVSVWTSIYSVWVPSPFPLNNKSRVRKTEREAGDRQETCLY